MSSSLAALREGTAALLEARGAPAEARIVRAGTLALLEGRRRWSVGSREVDALGFELALDAEAFAALRALPSGVDRVRDALGDAVASPDTMLADLFVVLRLPGPDVPWGAVYRTAPTQPVEQASDARSVRAAATALLHAQGHGEAAAALERAELSAHDVPSSGAVALRRWVVRFQPGDGAVVLRGPIEDAIRLAVAAAATRSAEAVAGVDVAVAERG